MIEVKERYFDLEKIAQSGQIFRMYETTCRSGLKNKAFFVYSKDRRLYAEQDYDRGLVLLDCSEAEYQAYWFRYFDLERDYSELIASVNAEDTFLKNAAEFGGSIRVLKQDIWEMMISFIISQQKQIPSIRKCIEALCERFGDNYGEWYGFPSAKAIAAAGPNGLDGLSLGYRARYIYETSVQYLQRGISDEELMSMDFDSAKKYLCTFTGIGEKVANCILLFGAGFVDAFPIDVHIKDILYREYYQKTEKEPKAEDKLKLSEYQDIIEKHFGRYAGYKGIIQQWIFAYEIQ